MVGICTVAKQQTLYNQTKPSQSKENVVSHLSKIGMLYMKNESLDNIAVIPIYSRNLYCMIFKKKFPCTF